VLFCPVYKGQEFSHRSTEEIKREIDLLGAIVEDIQRLSWRAGCGGKVTSAGPLPFFSRK